MSFFEVQATGRKRLVPNRGIEVAPLSDHLWKVRISFPLAETSDRDLLAQMREAKQTIALQFSVPADLLEFREIVGKEKTASGVVFNITIGRMEAGKGKTTLHLKPLKAPTGEMFEDMIAAVDFHYLDEFDQIITRERLLAVFDKWGLARELLDLKALGEALQRVIEERSQVKNLEVARGVQPELGTDAELEYTFFTEPSGATDLSEYHASRKVTAGDILCQKIPPKNGKIGGLTVLKTYIAPLKGVDFQLIPGEGARLSRDGLRLTALRDGLAVMKRHTKKVYTPAGVRTIPTKIEVAVKELIVIEGNKQIDISANSSIEITGDAKEGSSIRTMGEILLTGNVEVGAKLSAGSDVFIAGQVNGAQISSDASVFGSRQVKDSTITAEANIEVHGVVENSDLSADVITVLESLGCRIEARRRVVLERAGSDGSGHKTAIRMIRNDYYASQVEAEMQEIDQLGTSIMKLQEFFGMETMDQISPENLQRLVLAELKRLRRRGHTKLSPKQVESLKALLTAINPLRGVLSEKNEEIKVLLQKAQEEYSEKPTVVIKEKLRNPVEVTIDDVTTTLEPSATGVIVSKSEEGQINSQPLSTLLQESTDFPAKTAHK